MPGHVYALESDCSSVPAATTVRNGVVGNARMQAGEEPRVIPERISRRGRHRIQFRARMPWYLVFDIGVEDRRGSQIQIARNSLENRDFSPLFPEEISEDPDFGDEEFLEYLVKYEHTNEECSWNRRVEMDKVSWLTTICNYSSWPERYSWLVYISPVVSSIQLSALVKNSQEARNALSEFKTRKHPRRASPRYSNSASKSIKLPSVSVFRDRDYVLRFYDSGQVSLPRYRPL